MLAYLRLELLRTVRDLGYLIMSLISPLMMYLVFTNIGITGQDDHEGARYAMVGMAAFGAVGAVLTSGVGVAEDKALGWLRQLRLTPLSPARVVTARGACGMVLAVPPIVAVLLAGALVDGVSLGIGQWAATAVLLWLGVAPVTMLGLGTGYLFTAQQAQATGLVVYMGLSLLGGLWVPITMFPHWLQDVAKVTPINRYGELSWRVVAGHAPSPTGALVLVAWGAAFTTLAAYAYRRGGRTA